jgi:hypothetical protein
MDAILEVIAGAIPLACLPRPLVRDAEGRVGCDVVWELPPPGTGPAGVPTTCAQAPFLHAPEAGHATMTEAGGEICLVHQLTVRYGPPTGKRKVGTTTTSPRTWWRSAAPYPSA